MSPSASSQAAAWSAAVNGLRGRLVVDAPAVAASGKFRVDVELENVGSGPVALQGSNPHAYAATLRGAGGAELPPSFQRGDVLATVQLDQLGPGTQRRFTLSIESTDGAASAQLDLTLGAWKLPPGTYQLAATFSSTGFSGAPAGAWQGQLVLPPVALVVKP